MVTILVPVYNTELYLRECINSLISQTYTDLQIVIIDDGSTDGSWNLLQEIAKSDNRIEVYSQQNCGVATTRNRLLDKAHGEFVLFVDSDDWIQPNTIELLLNEQRKGDYDIVSFQLVQTSLKGGVYSQKEIIKLFLEHIFFRGSLCDKLIRSKLLDGLRIDPTVSYGEDALLVWQLLQQVKQVCVLNKVLYYYRINKDSLSHQRFNGKKFTSYTVWDTISKDVDEYWPEFSDLAHARFACEMTQILRDAIAVGYHHNSSVRLLQEEIRRDGHHIHVTGISSNKMRLFAWLVSHSYCATKLLWRLYM